MCNVADTAPSYSVDIWGSCVSRDTLQNTDEYSVGVYVARQSAIVALAPAVGLLLPLDRLSSEFQRKMLVGDLRADATDRLARSEGTCVLVDLVDERRGVWKFPDGRFVTNSIESYRTGIDEWAPARGARLIEFGTDEHFELWRIAFVQVVRGLLLSGKLVILLDIAWAESRDDEGRVGIVQSVVDVIARIGRFAVRNGKSGLKNRKAAAVFVKGLRNEITSPAYEHKRAARKANRSTRRYVDVAERISSATIRRAEEEVLMSATHRWGPAPYHYTDDLYKSIRSELSALMRQRNDSQK